MDAHDNHSAGNRTIRRLVGRLRGSSSIIHSSSSSSSSSTSGHGGVSTSQQPSLATPRTFSSLLTACSPPQTSPSPNAQTTHSPRSRGDRRNARSAEAQLCLDLWNAAYDGLRDGPRSSGLVAAYESIILQELPAHLKPGGLSVRSSLGEKTADQRQALLQAITVNGLRRRRSSSTSSPDDLTQTILSSVRSQVELAASEYDAAFVAWAGFCTLTPLLLDAIAQRPSFRNGFVHVVGRIPWYMHAARLLDPASWEDRDKFRETKNAVREMLIKLNRKVLEFEMNCVCATASAWNVAARNVVEWNKMDQLMHIVKELDGHIIDIIERNCTDKVRNALLARYRDMDLPPSPSTGHQQSGADAALAPEKPSKPVARSREGQEDRMMR